MVKEEAEVDINTVRLFYWIKRFPLCHNAGFDDSKHENAEKESNENQLKELLFWQLTDLRGDKRLHVYSQVQLVHNPDYRL